MKDYRFLDDGDYAISYAKSYSKTKGKKLIEMELKKKGVWIFSCEAGGDPYYAVDYDCPCAIVLGSEGNGVGKLIKDKSDFIISIPMYGKVNSLNVSTAASVILCHAARMQRGDK
mgnify:CR=1 FL=1